MQRLGHCQTFQRQQIVPVHHMDAMCGLGPEQYVIDHVRRELEYDFPQQILQDLGVRIENEIGYDPLLGLVVRLTAKVPETVVRYVREPLTMAPVVIYRDPPPRKPWYETAWDSLKYAATVGVEYDGPTGWDYTNEE